MVKTHSVEEPEVELRSSPEGTTNGKKEHFQKLKLIERTSQLILDC